MDYSKLMQGKPFIALVLLNIHLINGAVTSSGSGENYFGESFQVTFTIIPSFTVSATVSQDGSLVSSCLPNMCVPSSINNVTFTPSVTGIVVVFDPVSSSHQGNWQCQNNNGDISDYPFQPESRPSEVTSKGSTEGEVTSKGSTEGTSTPDGVQTGLIVGIVVACVLSLIPVAVLVSYRKGLFCFATSSKSPAIQREVSADAGSEVKLLPELRNIDNIKSVEWKHSGKTVQTGYENELMHENGTIPWVSREDSGFWLCKLKIENATEQNFVIQLNVTVHQYEEEEGMRVQLLNYIKTSQSFQRVQWYHGKSKISGNEKKYQGGTIQVPALFVGKLEKEDAGEYTCEIVLKKATLQIPVELAVKSTNRNSSLPPVGTPGLQTALTATS